MAKGITSKIKKNEKWKTRENFCNIYPGQRVNISKTHLAFTERELYIKRVS